MIPAVQFYTLREFTSTASGFREALRRCAEIGYTAIQLSAVGCMAGDNPEVSAEKARIWLDEFGLKCCATHRGWKQLSQSTDAEIAFHKTLGCAYVAVPGIGDDFGFDAQAYENFLVAARPFAANFEESGIAFGYHNHAHEFVRNPATGRPCIELLSNSANDWLQMEVDTYWVAEAGVSPADFLQSCGNRLDAIHVKDREIVLPEGQVMAPVGEGNFNWNAILDICEKAGTKWLIVEQDTCRRDPFSCLESSFNFLSGMLKQRDRQDSK